MTDAAASGREGRDDNPSPENDPSIEGKRKQLARTWQESMDNSKAAQQRLDLLRSVNHVSRTFADTMRSTAAERRRLAEEREELLQRERAARAEAEAARERLHEVLESIGDAFFALDRQWRFSYVNNRAVNLAGRPRKELLGESVWEAFPELVGDTASAELTRAQEQGSAAQFEQYSPRLDRWLHYRVYPSRAGLSVYTTDVTEQKKAEEALRKSEERYKALYEDNPFMYFIVDVQGTVLSVNRSGAQQLGYTVEELVGRPILDLFHEEDKEGASRYFSRCLQEDLGQPSTWEVRKVRKDGSVMWVKENVRLVPSPDGGKVVQLICEDVTGRKQAEEQVLLQAQLLEQVRAAVIFTDLQGTVIHWNEYAEKLYGWSREEVLGRNIMGLTVGPAAAQAEEVMERLRAGEAWEGEFVARRKDGSTFPAHVTDSLIYDAQGRAVGIVGVSTDITERKQTEKEHQRLLARESAARAEATERRKISRELHDRVAHSMGVVHQSLQLYKALLPRDPSQAEAKLALAQEMAKSALDSTRNLAMELRSSITDGDLESALSVLLTNSVPTDIEADLSIEGDESFVPAHVREQLFLILREAVRNAVSHSGCDRISVRLDILPEKVTGTVEDDGNGFEQDGSAESTGLKSMKERAALVGGTCSVRSEPNEGTRVQVSVPLGQEEQ